MPGQQYSPSTRATHTPLEHNLKASASTQQQDTDSTASFTAGYQTGAARAESPTQEQRPHKLQQQQQQQRYSSQGHQNNSISRAPLLHRNHHASSASISAHVPDANGSHQPRQPPLSSVSPSTSTPTSISSPCYALSQQQQEKRQLISSMASVSKSTTSPTFSNPPAGALPPPLHIPMVSIHSRADSTSAHPGSIQQQACTQAEYSPGYYCQHRHSITASHPAQQPPHHSYTYGPGHRMSVPSPYHHPHMHSSRQTVSASSSPVAGPGTSHMFPANRPLTAEEKELKRKVSHSAIEKRRRERTNAVLRELQTIVPGLCKPGKIQKLEILEATAEYIRQLSTVASIRQHQRQRQQQQRQQQQQQQQQQQRQPYSLHLYPQVQPQTQYRQPRQLNSTCPPELASVECTGSDSGKAENEDRQNLAIATPKSVSSNTLSEDSADDGPASESSTLPPDPSSINFLLC